METSYKESTVHHWTPTSNSRWMSGLQCRWVHHLSV